MTDSKYTFVFNLLYFVISRINSWRDNNTTKNNVKNNATIKIRDYAANETVIQIILSSHPIPKFDYSVNFNEETCFILKG